MAMKWLAICAALAVSVSAQDYASNPSIQLFQEYLRINTTSNGDLTPAVELWKRLAAEEGLNITVLEFDEGYPVVVIKIEGTDPSLSSIMLNSHIDVVPADEDEDEWTYPPFSATLDENGMIWARGTQDCKSVSIQYWEALKNIRAQGIQLLRDIYITLMPDEEIGGLHGMVPFLASDFFEAMNVGFELDEGTSSAGLPAIGLMYQDKSVWQIQVDCYGIAGHSSTFPSTVETATGKCDNFIQYMTKFRNEQYQTYETNTMFDAGSYTNVNLNIIEGGTANNVIPSHVILRYDMRLNTSLSEAQFEAQLQEWVAASGDNITLSYIVKDPQTPATLISASNPYYVALAGVTARTSIPIIPLVSPGATDGRYVRLKGIPAFGFSPMPNTPLLLHAVDERLDSSIFLQGISIYEYLLTTIANLPGTQISSDPSVYLIDTTA